MGVTIKTSFQNQIDAVNDAVNYAHSKVDSFVAGVRGEFPSVNVHFNSQLICSSGADDNGL
ncbi:hypothetical protein SAMN06269117_11470, partial [Balnearium lithotrophicum]